MPETKEGADGIARSRIIDATFRVMVEHGYARANTREIAKQAKVSKRELYALFGSKDAILAAMIECRARQMRLPSDLPPVESREQLAATLIHFGMTFLREVCHPAVTALFRLAVTEAERSPALAQALDEGGCKATRTALAGFLAGARANGLIAGAEPEAMAIRFFALLWGDLQTALLLGVAQAPTPAEAERRARAATHALLALYPVRD